MTSSASWTSAPTSDQDSSTADEGKRLFENGPTSSFLRDESADKSKSDRSASESAMLELSAADLGALLCSKVCHDIISPVGAISNGLELMGEDIDGEMKDMAFELIHRSASQASAKLKFARIAYGAAGSAGAEIDTGDAEAVARGYLEAEKPDLEWEVPRLLLPKNQVKLILNMVLLALNCIPHGGTIKVAMEGSAEDPVFILTCEGRNARVPEAIAQLAGGPMSDAKVDAHNVQPYYAGLLARLSGLGISFDISGEVVAIKAQAA
ncbi:MAG: histidine phosphotransferase family protein [Pseudomonadota bacterium]